MNELSNETLRRIEQNDDSLELLYLGSEIDSYISFNSNVPSDFSRLGASIGNNTHLTQLDIDISEIPSSAVAEERGFFDGLKRNTSIRDICVYCYDSIVVGGVVHEILTVYQEKNNLTSLRIHGADWMGIGGDNTLANTLRSCTNLKSISLDSCSMADEQLVPIVAAVRDHPMCENFSLYDNSIGNAGCGTIATLLEDSDCNVQTLSLGE